MNSLNMKNKEVKPKDNMQLTGYDLFMQQKYGNYLEKSSLGAMEDTSDRAKKAAKNIREKIKNMSFKVEKDSYKEQLVEKLKGGPNSLPNSNCYDENKKESIVSNSTSGRRLTKTGRIFISLYVIITLTLASTLLWVNMDGKSNIDANAESGYAQTERITPLAQNEEAESQNWFDRFCDSLNKT